MLFKLCPMRLWKDGGSAGNSRNTVGGAVGNTIGSTAKNTAGIVGYIRHAGTVG